MTRKVVKDYANKIAEAITKSGKNTYFVQDFNSRFWIINQNSILRQVSFYLSQPISYHNGFITLTKEILRA